MRDALIKSFSSGVPSEPLYLLPPATPSISMCNEDTVLYRDVSYTTDYEKLYNDLLKQCHILKSENKKLLEKTEKKNKREKWSRDEVAKAFALMYYSKRAYMYVRDELHYPLPGKNYFLFQFIRYFINYIFFRTFVFSAVG